MTLHSVALSVVVVFFGASLQAVLGFGMGVFAIPLLVWLDIALPDAIGIVLPNVLVQTTVNVWQHRDHLPWRDVWWVLLLRMVSMPLGLWLLRELHQFDPIRTKQLLGAGLLVLLSGQYVLRVRPVPRVAFGWTVVAGVTSGFLAGLIGMGGPPLVLWVGAHDWRAERQRAFLWLSFFPIALVQMLLMAFGFGGPLRTAVTIGVAVSPVVLVAAWWGGQWGRYLSRPALRALSLAVLTILALRLVLAPWVSRMIHSAS